MPQRDGVSPNSRAGTRTRNRSSPSFIVLRVTFSGARGSPRWHSSLVVATAATWRCACAASVSACGIRAGAASAAELRMSAAAAAARVIVLATARSPARFVSNATKTAAPAHPQSTAAANGRNCGTDTRMPMTIHANPAGIARRRSRFTR